MSCRYASKGCKGWEICKDGLCAGVDEAGRGPLAGPVVACAVILPPECFTPDIRDSKVLKPEKRRELYRYITSRALCWAAASVGPREIDRLNILRATFEAMRSAVLKLNPRPRGLIIDGPYGIGGLDIPQVSLVDGDSLCPLVAAASILAKVIRDRMMSFYHRLYPQYGFDRHKGYPTREHREALRRFGPSPIHRMSFRGVNG